MSAKKYHAICLTHKHESEVVIFEDEETARLWLLGWCQKHWDEDLLGIIPDDPNDAIDRYFEDSVDEWYVWDCMVPISSMEVWVGKGNSIWK